ncbi:MAG: phage shock protein operon transcriptional activator, partial [Pseudomonadales bacterium]|nr:phage shock protein operon transcriptional activator [Pseudomonadales bacterium]
KELIAARLHFLSNRWEGQYLKMNCAAISDSLLETELFGHEAGSFTGATRAHQGRFERANGGTLFLDELANTSPMVQEKLLRVIEYGEYERVGGNKTLHCDVRLIAATNEDLPALADAGSFRSDLLDRLAFDVLTLPPLREREQDILLLAESFAVSMASELGREYFPGFSVRARASLLEYDWPGNVRELKNVVERCVYRHDSTAEVETIVFDPFDSPFRPQNRSAASRQPAAATGRAEFPMDLKASVQDYEIDLINQAMEAAKFNQRKAAELLQVTYHQLRGYLKKYDLLSKE